MLEKGFIKLHRSLLRWEWYNNPTTMRVFIHLLLTVNSRDEVWHGLPIPRGSRLSSYAALAGELHLSVKAVRTALEHLEGTGEITRRTTPAYTQITVNHYSLYQGAPGGGAEELRE